MDREWLERVRRAGDVYGDRVPEDSGAVGEFVRWLWREWGYSWVERGYERVSDTEQSRVAEGARQADDRDQGAELQQRS